MVNGNKVIRIFCLADDLLKGIVHREDVRHYVEYSDARFRLYP